MSNAVGEMLDRFSLMNRGDRTRVFAALCEHMGHDIAAKENPPGMDDGASTISARTHAENRSLFGEERAEKLRLYLQQGHWEVEGWLDPYSAVFIASLGSIQCANDVAGATGEIGVHQGRLFILLDLLKRDAEHSVALDVFEYQRLNLDNSGCGDLERFVANLARWTGRARNVHIVRNSSLLVGAQDLVQRAGAFRLLSIDGGHTEECALNDLKLAEQVLHHHGIAILDDHFNQSWPGVSTGTARYVLEAGSILRPFAISPNKVYLANPEAHDFYKTMLRMREADHFDRSSSMYGSPVDIYGCEPTASALTPDGA